MDQCKGPCCVIELNKWTESSKGVLEIRQGETSENEISLEILRNRSVTKIIEMFKLEEGLESLVRKSGQSAFHFIAYCLLTYQRLRMGWAYPGRRNCSRHLSDLYSSSGVVSMKIGSRMLERVIVFPIWLLKLIPTYFNPMASCHSY